MLVRTALGQPARASTAPPADLLRRLLRFDTSNPPGNEAACIAFVKGLLDDASIETRVLASDPSRPNLVARLPGAGRARPLLLYGHVDVAPVEGQRWRVPPFEGREQDGFIWGRGALDMKSGVAMLVTALLRLRESGGEPPGDVVLALVSDEEGGGTLGARYLVESHASLFSGVRYAIGEVGGFPRSIAGRRFYPIQVAEKQICRVRATARGPGGHSAVPRRGGALARLTGFLDRLEQRRLPVHVTPVVAETIRTVAGALPGRYAVLLRGLSNPTLTGAGLWLLGERAAALDPLVRNTAGVTAVHAGGGRNVLPASASGELDGRILPGLTPAHLVSELRRLAGPGIELEVIRFEPAPAERDLRLFPTLAALLCERDPAAVAVPRLLPSATDARHFARLGIQTYGFLPLTGADGSELTRLVHAADERVPAGALELGTDAIVGLLSGVRSR